MAIEEFETCQKARPYAISVVTIDDKGELYFGCPKIPTENEMWMTLLKDLGLSKKFLYVNLRYKFVYDNPESGIELQNPLIEIQGEKLTCDGALKKMTYYLGDDGKKYKLFKSTRQEAKEYTRSLLRN